MFERPIAKVLADLGDKLIALAKDVMELRADPPRRSAEHLRAANSAIHSAEESSSSRVAAASAGDHKLYPNPIAPVASLHEMADRTNPEDGFLRRLYGERYHTDGSPLARTYARSLALVPERYHRVVAAHMRNRRYGGIWIGDASVLNLGHRKWSVATRHDAPQGWPSGSSWDDIRGVYDPKHRALFVGHDKATSSVNCPLHEFGHAFDDACGHLSQSKAFTEVYVRVISLMKQTSPEAVAYYTQPGYAGKAELFAEGFAWFYNGKQPQGLVGVDRTEQPMFFGSVAAGHHMLDYFSRSGRSQNE